MDHEDCINVEGLQLECQIGVPEGERSFPQKLSAHVQIWPQRSFDDLGEEIDATVDYAEVARRVRGLAAERPRHLVETLASETAHLVLNEFAVRKVRVEIRKYLVPECQHVAVSCLRARK